MNHTKYLVFTLMIFSIISCQQKGETSSDETIESLQRIIQEKELENKRLLEVSEKLAEDTQAGDLIHLVYFNTKPDLSSEQLENFEKEILKLKTIPFLKDLEIGTFEDLNDPRAMNDFSLLMQMRFSNTSEYRDYQEHPAHLKLKEVAASYLAAPPVTYDYLIQ